MDLKSIIYSFIFHMGILGAGLTGKNLLTSSFSFKNPPIIEITYINPLLKDSIVRQVPAKKDVQELRMHNNVHPPMKTGKPPEFSRGSKLSKRIIDEETKGKISNTPRLSDYLRLPALVYPETARQAQQEGEVEVSLSLDKYGCVHQVEILKSTNVILLDRAAHNTFYGKCIIKHPELFPSLQVQKLILPIQFSLH